MSEQSGGEVFGNPEPKLGFAIVALIAPLGLTAMFWLEGPKGQAVFASLLTMALMPFLFAPLLKRVWFWVALAVIAGAHAALVLLLPWGDDRLSGIELKPFMLADVLIVTGLIWLLSKVMPLRRRRPD